MKKNKINWKLLCKWGIIFGVFYILIIWIFNFVDKFICLNKCPLNLLCCFFEFIWFIFSIPVLIVFTIIFGPLGDRFPDWFHPERQGADKIIGETINYVLPFVVYFFIGVFAKIIVCDILMIDKAKIKKLLFSKNKIDWKQFCKWGVISGILGNIVMLFAFTIPSFINMGIMFGSNCEGVSCMLDYESKQEIIMGTMVAHIYKFIIYFFIGVFAKIIYNKTKKKKKINKNISLKKQKGDE